jgi:hypothetical protein
VHDGNAAIWSNCRLRLCDVTLAAAMFYNIASVLRYEGGILAAVDCPLAAPDGTVRLGADVLPPAFVPLTEKAFATFHFDVPMDPGSKLQWLNRYSTALRHLDFGGITSVADIASRCSGALSQVVPVNELGTLPPIGLIIAGLGSMPVRDFVIIGLHSYRRTDPNRPFTISVPFPAHAFGGNCLIAQFLDAKVFSKYFDRVQALCYAFLLHLASQRSLGQQGFIAPGLSVVEVSGSVDFRDVPRNELAVAKTAAIQVLQQLDLTCKGLSGAAL